MPNPEKYQVESLRVFYKASTENLRSSIFCEHIWETNPLFPKTECFRDETGNS